MTTFSRYPSRFRLIVLLVLSALIVSWQVAPIHAATPGDLETILASVPNVSASRTVLWYGSQGALQKALGVTVSSTDDIAKLAMAQRSTYLKLFGTQLYYSPFLGLENSPDWQKTFGFDSFDVSRELTIGAQPNWVALMDGTFDTGAISKALAGIGFAAGDAGRFTLGADNAVSTDSPAAALAQARYNRMIITPQRIIAAPSSALLENVVAASTGKVAALTADPSYLAVVRALESDAPLLSAVVLDGSYVQNTLLAGVKGSLPHYAVAGMGYQRDAQNNQRWVVVLIYAAKADADAAAQLLPGLISKYTSITPSGRALFANWKITAKPVTASADGKAFTVALTLALPTTTDVGLVTLVQARDIGFLAMR